MIIEPLIVPDVQVLFTQLVLASFLGLLVGVERSIAGKTAGMRTYALVSMGSALFVIISTVVTAIYLPHTDFDPLRVAAGIITGIGFLGAGMIILNDSKMRGLTTAASLWVAAGIGMAVGFRLYAIAIFTAFLTLFIFTILWVVEQKVKSLGLGKDILTRVEKEIQDTPVN